MQQIENFVVIIFKINYTSTTPKYITLKIKEKIIC